jgi:hypothetical protein
MRQLKLWALLLSVSVLTIAAVGNSAPFTHGNVTLMDFENKTDTLLGYPNGTPPLGWYQRTDKTANLAAVITPQLPPSPCKALSVVWNIVITKVPEGTARRAATRSILRAMTRHDCRANITRDESANPAAVIDISPTP